MLKFSDINTFYNILARNVPAYMRALFSDYEEFRHFRNTLLENKIYLISLNSIDETMFNMIRPKDGPDGVDSLFHCNFSGEIIELREHYNQYLHVLNIPPIDGEIEYHLQVDQEKIIYIEIEEVFTKKDLSFFDPFPAFFTALNNADKWGGVLLFNDNFEYFYPLHCQDDVEQITELLKNPENIENHLKPEENYSYIYHLSDFHLNTKKKGDQGLPCLNASIDFTTSRLYSNNPFRFIITGDLMDTPTRNNLFYSKDYIRYLRKNYKADVTYILGNHDVISYGLNLFKRQKSKVIAQLLTEHLKILEREKIILIKFESSTQGNLARGKIGRRQLEEVEEELEAIPHLERYTIIALLHHHVYKIEKADFIKTKWHERTFINSILDSAKALIDSDEFIQWLDKYNIKYVLHGHKHLPCFRYMDHKYIISAGSATGKLKEEKSKYLSYNILKYDMIDKKLKTCLIIYEDRNSGLYQRIEVYLFDEEENDESI